MRLALLFIPVCVFRFFLSPLVWFFLWLPEEVLALLFLLHCEIGDFSIIMKEYLSYITFIHLACVTAIFLTVWNSLAVAIALTECPRLLCGFCFFKLKNVSEFKFSLWPNFDILNT